MLLARRITRNPIYTHVTRREHPAQWLVIAFAPLFAFSAYIDNLICQMFFRRAIYYIVRSRLSLTCAETWADLAFNSVVFSKALTLAGVLAAGYTALSTAYSLNRSDYDLIRLLPLSRKQVASGYLMAGLRRILPLLLIGGLWAVIILARIASRPFLRRWIYKDVLTMLSGIGMLGFGIAAGVFVAFSLRGRIRPLVAAASAAFLLAVLIHLGWNWTMLYYLHTRRFAWLVMGEFYLPVKQLVFVLQIVLPATLTGLMVYLLHRGRTAGNHI